MDYPKQKLDRMFKTKIEPKDQKYLLTIQNVLFYTKFEVMLSVLKKIILFLASFLLLFSFVSKNSVFADTTCHQYTVPLTISPLDPTIYHIVGWLCIPENATTVQLTLSGATYSHVYWDFPYQPNHYSYTNYMNQQGYATFNIDRIGIGQSGHPAPELITIQANSFVAHQLIQDLRSGTIGTKSFQKVIVVGHSLGSGVAIDEAVTYGDVDGVILTGVIHNLNPDTAPLIANAFYPAFLDPQFAGKNLAPGYFTTKPGGIREQLFYYSPNADPVVIATDELTKETITDAEVAGIPTSVLGRESLGIHVPTLEVNGQFDQIVCGGTVNCNDSVSVANNEQSFYSSDAHLQIYIAPDAGHDVNLHTNAHSTYTAINQWLQQHFSN